MSEPGAKPRVALLRASLLFQLKLLADGFRDFLLVPVSLVATAVGLLRSGEDPEREFEQVLDLGRRSERWINLFGTHDAQHGEAANLDQVVTRVERVVREQVKEGNVSASAGVALQQTLEALQRRAREGTGSKPSVATGEGPRSDGEGPGEERPGGQ